MENNVCEFPVKENFIEKAKWKMEEEQKSFSGGKESTVVAPHVASVLTHFCEEDERFAEVICKTKRTLSDCCKAVMKGCGTSISDIDVYRGAVRFYFPNADIQFFMRLEVHGDAPSAEELEKKSETPANAEKKVTKTKSTKASVEKKETKKKILPEGKSVKQEKKVKKEVEMDSKEILSMQLSLF